MSAADRPGRGEVKKSGGKRRFPVSVPIPRRRKDRQFETPVEETGVSGPEKDGPAAPPAEHPPGMPAGGGPSAPATESDAEIPPPEKDGAAPQGEEEAASTGVAEDRATSVGAEEAASADVEDAVPPSTEDAGLPGGEGAVPPDADGAGVERPPGLDAEVAQAVLEVADRLTSPDLRRRLAEAVGPLPGATVIVPGPGARFDPDVHEWVSSRPPPREDLRETVAETLHAGLADRTGRLLRPARVIVYDVPEE